MLKQLIFPISLLISLYLSCTTDNSLTVTETETGNLFGVVVSVAEAPIPNANVYLYSKSAIDNFKASRSNWIYQTTTNDTGYYSFDTVISGDYYLEVKYDTLLGALQQVAVFKNVPQQVNIVAKGFGMISGSIDSLLIIEDAGYIWVAEINTLVQIGEDGLFTINYLPEFTFNLKVLSKIDTSNIPSTIDTQNVIIIEDSVTNLLIKKSGNVKPIANAGIDQNAFVGDTVYLDGSESSDYNNDSLTYSWSIISRPAGSSNLLSNQFSSSIFFIPDIAGSYTIELIVNDGIESSIADTLIISSSKKNSKPIADAGSGDTLYIGDTLFLDGSNSSDIDNDTLHYSWSLLSSPDSSVNVILDSSIVNPILILDAAGEYLIQLVVNDGKDNSDPDSLTIKCHRKIPSSSFFWAIDTGNIFWSEDGNAWNPTHTNLPLSNITFKNGDYYGADFNKKIYHSEDGLNWTLKHSSSGDIKDIIISTDKIISVGSDSKVCISTDGNLWTDTTFDDTTWNSNSITYGNSKFVLVMNRGNGIKNSDDGVTWNECTYSSYPDPGPALDAVTFAAGQFVAVGPGGAITKSTDGENWTDIQLGGGINENDLNKIIYDGSKFIAIGPSDRIATSVDGSSWNYSSTGTGETLKEITYGNSIYMIATESKILFSSNLTEWNESISRGANEILYIE